MSGGLVILGLDVRGTRQRGDMSSYDRSISDQIVLADLRYEQMDTQRNHPHMRVHSKGNVIGRVRLLLMPQKLPVPAF